MPAARVHASVLEGPLLKGSMATRQVLSLLEDARAGRPLRGPTPTGAASPLSPASASALFPVNTVRSPRAPSYASYRDRDGAASFRKRL